MSTKTNVSEQHDSPLIIGRYGADGESLDKRAGTRRVTSAEMEYVSGALGTARVTLFKSNDDEDRGGYVVRFEIEDSSSSMLPYATISPKGVDLHLCGDAEAATTLKVLRSVLALLEGSV